MIANSFRFTQSRPRTSLVTDRAVAHRLQVSARMVRLWVDTGAWPLPCCTSRTSFWFGNLGSGALARDGRLAGRGSFPMRANLERDRAFFAWIREGVPG